MAGLERGVSAICSAQTFLPLFTLLYLFFFTFTILFFFLVRVRSNHLAVHLSKKKEKKNGVNARRGNSPPPNIGLKDGERKKVFFLSLWVKMGRSEVETWRTEIGRSKVSLAGGGYGLISILPPSDCRDFRTASFFFFFLNIFCSWLLFFPIPSLYAPLNLYQHPANRTNSVRDRTCPAGEYGPWSTL